MSSAADAFSRDKTSKSVLASVLLHKLRWSTLGLQFDWSKRNYNDALPHNKILEALAHLAKRMAAPAMKIGEVFQPEAALVNYFGPGDTLGGHLDDMEADWNKPIVSMSFGCKALFLLGRKSRDDPPLAMFLRSGDIVLMAGEVSLASSPMNITPKSTTSNPVSHTKMMPATWNTSKHPESTSTLDKSIKFCSLHINFLILGRQLFDLRR